MKKDNFLDKSNNSNEWSNLPFSINNGPILIQLLLWV